MKIVSVTAGAAEATARARSPSERVRTKEKMEFIRIPDGGSGKNDRESDENPWCATLGDDGGKSFGKVEPLHHLLCTVWILPQNIW